MNPFRFQLSAYPLALPHIAAQAESRDDFLHACNGRRKFEELIALDPQFASLAKNLDEVEWLEHPLGEFERAENPEPVLIFAAHPEDAYLSMGGWLLEHRATAAATIVSCFSSVLATTRPEAYVSPKEISSIRHDEAELCGRMTGSRHVFLHLPSAEVRAATPGGADEIALRRSVKLMLWRLITDHAPAQVFVSAGIGAGRDQRLLLEAILEIFEDAWFPTLPFHLFEDFPFCASYLAVDDFLATFENGYIDVQTWFEDVTLSLEAKLTLLGIFKSRLLGPHQELARRVAQRNLLLCRDRAASPGGLERFWTLRLATELCLPS